MSELLGASADPAPPPGAEATPTNRPPARRAGGSPPGGDNGSGAGVSLQRAAAWMAAGTGLSRLTGVFRVLALAFALGATRLADGYNLANTTPNMIYDIVLGGVLSATFIPVFVDRLATRAEDEAWDSISAVVTLSVVVLAGASVVFWVAAPLVIHAFTVLDPNGTAASQHHLAQERAVATSLLRWFVPQVLFYGLISLVTALLNTRRRFVAPMWVPIANNLVCIAVLLWFASMVGRHPSLAGVESHRSQLILLGLGTTLGVVVQFVLLLPSLGRARLSGLGWRWEPGNEAVRRVLGLGSWTFALVLANQIALFVVLALAGTVGGRDPVSAYTYAYTFLQMPYAVVAVSVMSAVTPDLAERWATRDTERFRWRLSGGLRAVLAIIIPASLGMLILARPAIELLLGHGAYKVQATGDISSALAMFALGLPGFCTFLYVVRVLQAMQRTKVAFELYVVENVINVVLAVALVHPLGVAGLALSLSVGYTVAAVAGLAVLRRWLGDLGGPRTWAPLRRVVVASLLMGVVVLVVSNLSGSTTGLGLVIRVGASVVAGLAVYGGTVVLLARRSERNERAARRPLVPLARSLPRR